MDTDCKPGFVCLGYSVSECAYLPSPPERFACQTPNDTCASFFHCEDGMRCGGSSNRFQCDVPPTNPGCGRPFLVDGAERVAAVRERQDWLEAELLFDGELPSPELRACAAAAWAQIGQMEHASVAAFARFALQLLQLGAPAELVEGATLAMQDEIRHARLAFAIASRCAGRNYGPGPLDVERSLEQTSLADVLRLVMREGCIGETVAALSASEAAEQTASAGLRPALSRVAADEARHAELAWRFVRWALEKQPSLAAIVRSELSHARAELVISKGVSRAEDPALLSVGILPELTQRALRRAALDEVIEPCALALLAQWTPHSASPRPGHCERL